MELPETFIADHMPENNAQLHPHDIGLPVGVVRKRRRFRNIGYLMLALAVISGLPGWYFYGVSILDAFTISNFTVWQAVAAYSLLIISSITLLLGLWYLLLAQVRRLARVVEGGDMTDAPPKVQPLRCGNCGWPMDTPDRFCRHCGKPALTADHATPSN